MRTPVVYELHLDESGVPSSNDPCQKWLVIGGITFPSSCRDEVLAYINRCYQKHLPDEYLTNKIEIKGRKLLHPNQNREPCGFGFQRRINLARELLAVDMYQPDVKNFVAAADTRAFPVTEFGDWEWARILKDLTVTRPYSFVLSELIGDFAFSLDRYLSSGIEELTIRPYDQRQIDMGRVFLDRNTHLERQVHRLSEELVRGRSFTSTWQNPPDMAMYRLLDENVSNRIELVDSKESKLIQLADILCALVRIKQNSQILPDKLEELYWEARLSFQTSSRFYPYEQLPCPIVRSMSAERRALLRGSGILDEGGLK